MVVMKDFVTKKQMTARIKGVSYSIAAAILGIGVGLTISIIFTKIGIWLIGSAALIAATGSVLSKVAPNHLKYQQIKCPFCRENSQVRLNAKEYTCDNCRTKLAVEKFEVKKYRHLKLVVNNEARTYGKPGTFIPINLGPQKKGNC